MLNWLLHAEYPRVFYNAVRKYVLVCCPAETPRRRRVQTVMPILTSNEIFLFALAQGRVEQVGPTNPGASAVDAVELLLVLVLCCLFFPRPPLPKLDVTNSWICTFLQQSQGAPRHRRVQI